MPLLASVIAALALAVGIAGSPVCAEPMRLDDPTPRSVIVRFENSSRNEPALLDRRYGPPLLGRIEPAGADLVRVVIDGSTVAQHLFWEDDPDPDSFSDFVWLFDVQSGHVLDARLGGSIVKQLDWGLVRSSTRARVSARMSTREQAGFWPALRVLGNSVFRYCDPSKMPGGGCQAVEAVSYDSQLGYVNAVGVIEVVTPLGIEARTFSPLGEALFLELARDSEPVQSVAAGGGAVLQEAP